MAMRAALSVVIIALAGSSFAQSLQFEASSFPCQGEVKLYYDNQILKFDVEIADRPELRARGMMGRTELDEDAGMLFLFEGEAPRAFWMKNTNLPLDILFFDQRGEMVARHEMAQPFDETPLPSPPASAVLEIRGGSFAQIGWPSARLAFSIEDMAKCTATAQRHQLLKELEHVK